MTHYFTEDTKVKELRAIYEAMEAKAVMKENDEVEQDSGPSSFEVSQQKTDAERRRREAEIAAQKNAEKKVHAVDFNAQIAEIEELLKRNQHAIEFATKQMEVDPENKLDYEDIVQSLQDKRNVLSTKLKTVQGQAATQADIVSHAGTGVEDGSLVEEKENKPE